MSFVALLILGFAIVPAFAMALLGWLALECDAQDIGFYVGFEGAQPEA
jgi:hypothetical protein